MRSTPLKFNYLKFNISDIIAMINDCPTILDFVFTAASMNADGYFQLIAHARILVENEIQYSGMTMVLEPYRGQAYQVDGPVVLSNNFISIATMNELIDGQTDNPSGFLLFTPGLTSTNYIYYSISVHAAIGDGGVTGPINPGADTNPSPPATINL